MDRIPESKVIYSNEIDRQIFSGYKISKTNNQMEWPGCAADFEVACFLSRPLIREPLSGHNL